MRSIITAVFLFSFIIYPFSGSCELLHYKFKFNHHQALKKIPEPSGIAYDKETGNYYIVSDHGMLFECDSVFNIVRKADEEGMDFEGVVVRDSFIYVSDETPRFVYKYRKSDLALMKKYPVSWSGAMNKSFESIAYNKAKNCFLLVSQQPAVIVEFDEHFRELERTSFKDARDISDAGWYNGFLYLLSGKEETIYKCDPLTYKPTASYKINVLNPEGLTFDALGRVYVVSDDLQRIYFFNRLPNNTDQ